MANKQQNLFETEPAPWELDDAAEEQVARVVFADPPHGPFDYLVPDALRGTAMAGCRVQVPLGRANRRVIGYCVAVQQRTIPSGTLKEVRAIMDAGPLLSEEMLELTRWLADEYLCAWGVALEAVLPAGVRGQAGTRQVTFWHVPTSVAARLTQLKLPKKQAAVIRHIWGRTDAPTTAEVARAVGCTSAPIKSLEKKGLIRAETRRVHLEEIEDAAVQRSSAPELTGDQRRAVDQLVGALDAGKHQTLLLHGATGSGKTEVYIQAIEHVIRFGRQAIVLVPEISLTPQTRRRFRSRLDSVAVLHSNLTPHERHWHWQRIARGEVQVVVGARSAVFAPTPQLGLIVMDEEHESTFKQDSLPRYHARDVAERRADALGIPLLLGSATPSLASWRNAQLGRYQLLSMPKRVSNLPMPAVRTIDLRDEYRDRFHRGAISRPLMQAVQEALRDGGQVILLLNRRGFSTHIQCPSCGEAVRCLHCDISLTHHRDCNQAVCHYCDYRIPVPRVCPGCGFDGIYFGGLGTQRLEDEVRSRFPEATYVRMDSDTMRRPGSHEEALSRFRTGEVDILLGTQMIAKGLDFPNVTLVGVINADTALHLPDFRAGERTFQLVTQVAGRTGRSSRGGRVLVQTFSPDHYAIQTATTHDYLGFVRLELEHREHLGYPPFSTMVRIVARGPQQRSTESFIEHLADRLNVATSQQTGVRMLGPCPAPISKVRGKYRFHLVLCGPEREAMIEAVRSVADGLSPPDNIQWIVDPDPLDML